MTQAERDRLVALKKTKKKLITQKQAADELGITAFTPADEKLSADLYRRGVSLETLRRAIWLGCARKYMAMLNGQPAAPIASLGYFTALLDEVTRAPVSDCYWEHVRQKLQRLERRWQQPPVPPVSAEG